MPVELQLWLDAKICSRFGSKQQRIATRRALTGTTRGTTKLNGRRSFNRQFLAIKQDSGKTHQLWAGAYAIRRALRAQLELSPTDYWCSDIEDAYQNINGEPSGRWYRGRWYC